MPGSPVPFPGPGTLQKQFVILVHLLYLATSGDVSGCHTREGVLLASSTEARAQPDSCGAEHSPPLS